MKNAGLLLLALVVAIAIGVGGFILIDSSDDSEDSDATNESSQNETNDVADTDNSANETSEPTGLPDTGNTTSVSLDSLGVSFFVPASVSETTDPSIHKQYQNPDSCEYIGQGENILVIAFETGTDCENTGDFTAAGSRVVTTSDQTLTLSASTIDGQKDGTVLRYESIDLDNNVTVGFFYKESVASQAESTVTTVLETFEVEL